MWATKNLSNVVSANRVVAGGWMEGSVVVSAVRYAVFLDS